MPRLQLVIGYLYPDSMNTYGDRGNIITLARRCQWRGMEADVREVRSGEPLPKDLDLIFVGGGQDKEQKLVCDDFQRVKGEAIKEAVEEGVALLSICGGYQLLGHYFRTGDGGTLPGIGLFDAYTVAGPRRCIGDVIVESEIGGQRRTLVGFENHSGQTFLGPGARPLGKVLFGFGNNGEDGFEGAVYKTAYGCYLHGSLLPKNPWFADHLIFLGLRHHYGEDVELPPLDDETENLAHEAVIERIRRRGKIKSGAI